MLEVVLAMMTLLFGIFLGRTDGRETERTEIIKAQKVCAKTKDVGVAFEKCWTLVEDKK